MNENKKNNNEIKQTSDGIKKKTNQDMLKWIIIGLAGFVIVVLVFSAGMIIGGIKARFSYRWAESYHKNFVGPKEGFLGDWQKFPPSPDEFIGAHGLFGQIMKIDGSTLIIKGRDGVEKIVQVKDNTLIKSFKDTIKITDLKVNEYIVVIGEPNDAGQIEAKFIRLMPPMPGETSFKPLPSRIRWPNL